MDFSPTGLVIVPEICQIPLHHTHTQTQSRSPLDVIAVVVTLEINVRIFSLHSEISTSRTVIPF